MARSVNSPDARLHVVGVRHHSPACARLVQATIESVRPDTVLIEGPCDLNGRLDELRLDHELPVALFTFVRSTEVAARTRLQRASWYPLCSYSPEWVALECGARHAGSVAFMDLPAWHDAFEGVVNVASDRVDRYDEAIALLCARTSTNGHDALWDHLFEGVSDLTVLATALRTYFEEIRSLSPVSARDAAREQHMARYVRAALARGGDVVVVCGGYHAPVLAAIAERAEGEVEGTDGEWPADPVPENATAETYLVPYSYARLDAFTGYQSGMPSPAYYDALYRYGPAAAADELMNLAVRRLRAAGQQVSTADLVAARTQAEGLARLRAHPAPMRVDLLDGLASGFLKDAADQPFPWDVRAPLHPRTHPMLAVLVAAFSGDRVGRLDPATPRPPLLADARAELENSGISPSERERVVALDLTRTDEARASAVLHRLRVLAIPGFSRSDAGLTVNERWTVIDAPDADVALIEASVYGPTLESAAAARLRNAIDTALGQAASDAVVAALLNALHCTLDALADEAAATAAAVIDRDPDIGRVGMTIDHLAALVAAVEVRRAGSGDSADSHALLSVQVSELIRRSVARFAWLLEQVAGASSPSDESVVRGIAATCRAIRRHLRPTATAGPSDLDPAVVAGVLQRKGASLDTPPAVRGACLGAQWSLGLFEGDGHRGGADFYGVEVAVTALRAQPPGEQPGDLLSGLFAIARPLVFTDDRLLSAVDALIGSWTAEEFLAMIPRLRRAFSWFPARERSAIGDRVAALRGLSPRTRLTGQLDADPELVAAGLALDVAINRRMAQYWIDGDGNGSDEEAR